MVELSKKDYVIKDGVTYYYLKSVKSQDKKQTIDIFADKNGNQVYYENRAIKPTSTYIPRNTTKGRLGSLRSMAWHLFYDMHYQGNLLEMEK